MEILFLTILGCHIPYIYFSGKEALLIVVDEIMRRSISLVLTKKLLQTQENGGDKDEIDAIPIMPEDLDFGEDDKKKT